MHTQRANAYIAAPDAVAALRRVEDYLHRVAETHAANAVYDELRRHFTDEKIADLTVVGMINLRNRLAVGLCAEQAAEVSP